MSSHIACSNFNADCPAEFTAPDEEELIRHVELHTKSAHPQMEWTPELVEVVKTKVSRS
jgi:predicted small metal-binding protein